MRVHLLTAMLFAASLAACAIALVLNASAASIQSGASADREVWRPIAEAPAAARSEENPYAGQRDAILAGEKLFRQHCAACHGDDAKGRRNAPSLRGPGVQNASDGELVWFLRSGNLSKGMPAWSGLPKERRWQIVSYLKSLGARVMSKPDRTAR